MEDRVYPVKGFEILLRWSASWFLDNLVVAGKGLLLLKIASFLYLQIQLEVAKNTTAIPSLA